MRRITSTTMLLAVVTCSALLSVAGGVHAQGGTTRDFKSGMRTGIGYSGVVPEALLGVSVFQMLGDRGIGIFADGKMTESGPSRDGDYCPPAISVCTDTWVLDERNDQHLADENEWLIFNAGIVYALTRELAVLIGGGMARHSSYAEYFDNENDPELRITQSGSYFVDFDPQPGWGVQFVAGAMLRAGNRLAFRFGYETAPGGMSVGGYVVFP